MLNQSGDKEQFVHFIITLKWFNICIILYKLGKIALQLATHIHEIISKILFMQRGELAIIPYPILWCHSH